MRLIIAGDRNFTDWDFVNAKVYYFLANSSEIEIVSGACSIGKVTWVRKDGTEVCGVDGLGEKYASVHDYPIRFFPADWKKHGRAAGPIRNKEMGEYGTHLLAFLKKGSKGTANMIKVATDLGLIIRIVNI